MVDIDQMLSYEVKKEIADRYFGFRKLIEDDIRAYDNEVGASFRQLEQQVGMGLIRLYILLKDEDLIHAFFHLVGWRNPLFYDAYFLESSTIRKRVFAGIQPHGFTKKRRFRNLVFETYEQLVDDVAAYNKTVEELQDEQATIAEEIKLFYRKNDLHTIMGFLRSLGGSSAYKAGSMEGGLVTGRESALEKKMRVKAPPPVEALLPQVPPLPPISRIRSDLDRLVEQAYVVQGAPDVRDLLA